MQPNSFLSRHIGSNLSEKKEMLEAIGVSNVDELIEQTIPSSIRRKQPLNIEEALSEYEYIKHIERIASKNTLFRSYIGQGYYQTITPSVIQRNIFENPGWYTQYTPYQAEISQGRLEALLNFQTMISDLTALPIANASLLDEATAAAEAMTMFFNYKNKRTITASKCFVDEQLFPQTIDVLKTRANPLNIELVIGNYTEIELTDEYFAILIQYPNKEGSIENYQSILQKAQQLDVYCIMATDLLSLTLLPPPGELGVDCAIGSSQRLGIPLGYGGPHAAFFATKEPFKRLIPGRIIGVSVDRHEQPAYRMALQTREQHIRREKATSNICTAQALLAIMAGMYAVYHGPEGLKNIALSVHKKAVWLYEKLKTLGFTIKHHSFFDTICVEHIDRAQVQKIADQKKINLWYTDQSVQISIDETVTTEDLKDIVDIFVAVSNQQTTSFHYVEENVEPLISTQRTSSYLTHPVFHTHQTETKLMRYIKSLENKDLSLTHSMISLGSCTMKLNAASELIPVSWPAFSQIHPFVPSDQVKGYLEVIHSLETYLADITELDATSLQPNSGAQGEYAGLLVIRAYQKDIGEGHRNIVLIPESAHGTNPASAIMAGCKVVVVQCDKHGNISMDDLLKKAADAGNFLSACMITYPSTHGVFEHHIQKVCQVIHEYGGQVYMDGANMNAQVGLTSPGSIGADVCHLNLHKTFAIPHGGGGPGMGPICVKKHLTPYLPGHPIIQSKQKKAIHSISASPWGSPSILLISYAYIKLLGGSGLTEATKYAILHANYIKKRLEGHYDVLYVGKEHGSVAHELIIDCRSFKATTGVDVEDIAKRLIDYGFHAPTISFPVPGTMMIEPTESESKDEIDRFCEALLSIRNEIQSIHDGIFDKTDNPLKNAPHTAEEATSDSWNHPYSRTTAVYPAPYVQNRKFWPPTGRINNSQGDRNLICTCPPVEFYAEPSVPSQ